MATHSSSLAWRISWTEEFGGLQLMGCKESNTTEVNKYELIEYVAPKVNPEINYVLWVIMRCQYRFIDYSKCSTLVGMLIMEVVMGVSGCT